MAASMLCAKRCRGSGRSMVRASPSTTSGWRRRCAILLLGFLFARDRHQSPSTPRGSFADALSTDDYERYIKGTTGKSNWPRPVKGELQLKEWLYFKDTSSHAEKMQMRERYLAKSAERVEALQGLLGGVPKDKPVVMMIVNYGQLHLFMNWVCGLRAKGMAGALQQSILWTADNGTYEATRDLLPTYLLGPDELLAPGSLNIRESSRTFGDRIFLRMMMLKVASLYTMVSELGRDVLYMDVDIAWNFDPLPLFYSPSYRHAEILFSYDGNARQPPFYINAGFFFVRSGPTTKDLVHDFFYYQAKKAGAPVQPIMNRVLMHYFVERDLQLEVLPTTVVPHPGHPALRGKASGMRTQDGLEPMVVHAAWTINHWNKVTKLHRAGLWFFNRECSLYNENRITVPPGLKVCMENPGDDTCRQAATGGGKGQAGTEPLPADSGAGDAGAKQLRGTAALVGRRRRRRAAWAQVEQAES